MKLLVVGGSSFIARNFLEQNDFSELDVTATHLEKEDFPLFVKKLDKNIHPLKYNFLVDKLDFSGFDACIYFAGNANHTLALENKQQDLTLNTTGLLNFLGTFRGRLIYMSSGAVYYGLGGLVSPESTVSPSFPYAISKLASEYYIRSAAEEGRISGFTTIRFYYAFGPYESSRRLIPRLFTQFVGGGLTEFAVNGDGRTLMQPMHVYDAVSALFRVVQIDKGNLTIDLCSPKPFSLKDLVEKVAIVCGVRVAIKTHETSEKPIEFYSSPKEFNKVFSFEPKYNLRTGLEEYLNWWKNAKG